MFQRCIKYGNNRNNIFIIDTYKNYVKITTYRKSMNGCLKPNSIKYFPLNSVINFSGNSPFIDNFKSITTYSAQLWNSRNIYNKWKGLVHTGNEWTLYQKDLIQN